MTSGPSRRFRYWRYAVAVLIVAVAGLTRWVLDPMVGTDVAFVTFFPAVALAAMIAGGRAGIVATLLSALVVAYWILPPQGLAVEAGDHVIGLILFCAGGLLMSVMAHMLARERRRAAMMLERARAARERELTIEFLNLVNASRGTHPLIEAAVGFFRLRTGCEAVGIRLREGNDYPYSSAQGFPDGFLREENLLLGPRPQERPVICPAEPQCMCGRVVSGRFDPSQPFFTLFGSFWTNDLGGLLRNDEAKRMLTRGRCRAEGYESVALISLRSGEERLGLIQLNDRRKGAFTAEDIALWERFAGHLGVALAKARAEEAQQRSEALLLEAEHLSRTGAWEWDLATGRWTFSDEWLAIHGCGRRSPSPAEWLPIVHPADRPAVVRALEALRAGRSPCELEHRVVRPDTGEVRTVRVHGRLTTDGAGVPARALGVAQDITERKSMEEELQRANEDLELRVAQRTEELRAAHLQLQQYNLHLEQTVRERTGELLAAAKAKDQFIASLSHELRTPLTPALAAVSVLSGDGRLPPDAREDLAMVQRNIGLEVQLIHDLLDVSRAVSGKVHLEKRLIDVAEAIREAAAIVAGDLLEKEQGLVMETPGAPYLMLADPARLQQVFWNLLRNACKFTPEGGRITVRARLEPNGRCPLAADPCPLDLEKCPQAEPAPAPARDNLTVEVSDTGYGITPEMLRRIFMPFEQGTGARAFGGLGLGLSICKAVIEGHGGTIQAHSDGPGKGATFTTTLAVAQCPRASMPGQPSAPARSRQGQGAAPQRGVSRQPDVHPAFPRSSRRILLVEDHADTATMMQRLLQADGFEVLVAGSIGDGLEAIESAAGGVDLIISDLGLPDGSGHDLLRRLRERGEAPPAIALSGYGSAADIEQSRSAGFYEHLTKPIDFAALRDALGRIPVPRSS